MSDGRLPSIKDFGKYKKALSTDIIEEFLSEKNVSKECSCCGNTSWGIDMLKSDDVSEYNLVSRHWLGENFKPAYAETIPLFCRNCGNIRIFSGHIIRIWRQEREASQ